MGHHEVGKKLVFGMEVREMGGGFQHHWWRESFKDGVLRGPGERKTGGEVESAA